MKIVFMGTPSFAVPILEALASKYEICLVVSQPDRIKKKGSFLPTPVKEKALALGIQVFQPEKIKDDYEILLEQNADVLITAAYGQYIPSKILNAFPYALNVHGSLLPKHRGGAPIQRCLMNGDTKTGVCIMKMVKRLDAGDVYAVREIDILDSDNNTSLFERVSILGRDLLLEVVEDIVSGKLKGIPQIEEEATYSVNLSKEEEKINFDLPSKEVFNQIRGLSMEPGAYFEHNETVVKVFASEIINWEGNEIPGTILSLKKQVLIKTKDGAIALLSLLLPGKKIITGKDFVNGQKVLKEFEVIKF